MSYQAPIPMPEHFRQYDEVVPGAAERILAMAEKQLAHRQTMEEKLLKNTFFSRNLGLFIGCVACFCFTGIVVYAIYSNQSVTALVSICSAFASITTAFIVGRNSGNKIEKNSIDFLQKIYILRSGAR